MSKRTTELLAKLKKMATQAGEALFERAGMAADVLADAQWIADTFGGDKAKAEEVIKGDYFPDVSMGGWFGRLLVLRQSYSLEVWREHKFDLQRLWIEYQKGHEEQKPKDKRQPPIARAEHEKVKEELASSQYQLRRAKEQAVNWEERCRDLERELAEARGRIVTLEMLLEKYAPHAAVA